MDSLPELGREINQNVMPTFGIYTPILESRKAVISSTRRHTSQYGNHPRQALDIYYPETIHKSSEPKPVLIWIFGGGFNQGCKILPSYAGGTVYANIGHFFATEFGFTVICPNYRLVADGGYYLSGGEDLALTINWVQNVLTKKQGYESINLFLLGNSAGGVNLATYILHDYFATSRKSLVKPARNGVRLKAVLFLSVPFHFRKAHQQRLEALQSWFRGPDLETMSPIGLLRSQNPQDSIFTSGVNFSVLRGTLDPVDEILEPTDEFVQQWKASPLHCIILEGHNHMSPQLSLGTGIACEERWGFDVGQFCLSSCT